jgi:hypothetical protein
MAIFAGYYSQWLGFPGEKRTGNKALMQGGKCEMSCRVNEIQSSRVPAGALNSTLEYSVAPNPGIETLPGWEVAFFAARTASSNEFRNFRIDDQLFMGKRARHPVARPV